MAVRHVNITEAENLGGQGELESPHFLNWGGGGAEPPQNWWVKCIKYHVIFRTKVYFRVS